MTNFPENICCSSSATIGSSDHVLVKVDISLAVIREPPQRHRVWHFNQADRQGLQAALKLLDWSPIAIFSNINSSWEFFQRNLLSLMHRFIPSRLQLSYPYSRTWLDREMLYNFSIGFMVFFQRCGIPKINIVPHAHFINPIDGFCSMV